MFHIYHIPSKKVNKYISLNSKVLFEEFQTVTHDSDDHKWINYPVQLPFSSEIQSKVCLQCQQLFLLLRSQNYSMVLQSMATTSTERKLDFLMWI